VITVDLTPVLARLDALEALMTAETDALRAKLIALAGEVTPEGQVILDEIVAKVEAFDTETGDADGSDTPEPAPEEPAAPVE